MSAPPMPAVQVTGLRKSFRAAGAAIEAVSGIDLTVTAGEIFGLLGPNGAGKPVTELRHSLPPGLSEAAAWHSGLTMSATVQRWPSCSSQEPARCITLAFDCEKLAPRWGLRCADASSGTADGRMNWTVLPSTGVPVAGCGRRGDGRNGGTGVDAREYQPDLSWGC